jgi:uncharacterized membrane protein
MRYKTLGSSANPEKLALTIKGALLTLIPVIVLVAGGLNITLNPDDLVAFVNTLFGIFTLGMTAYGLIRKIKNRLN